MKRTSFYCTVQQRKVILKALGEALSVHSKIVFAYAYGSFLEDRPFHDIDVGVYVKPEAEGEAGLLSLDLAIDLELAVMRSLAGNEISPKTADGKHSENLCSGRFPVDVRVLNGAPISFCYHVLRGHLLFSGDEIVRVRWAEQVMSRYLDIKPLRYRAFKEAMVTWG